MSEPAPNINVTPLIDVVLVLLIVFMAVSPAQVQDLDVQLVVSSPAAEPAVVEPDQLVLSLEDTGVLRVGEQIVRSDELTSRLAAVLAKRTPEDRALFIVAGDGVGYATLVETIEAAKRAGTTAIGFATDATP